MAAVRHERMSPIAAVGLPWQTGADVFHGSGRRGADVPGITSFAIPSVTLLASSGRGIDRRTTCEHCPAVQVCKHTLLGGGWVLGRPPLHHSDSLEESCGNTCGRWSWPECLSRRLFARWCSEDEVLDHSDTPVGFPDRTASDRLEESSVRPEFLRHLFQVKKISNLQFDKLASPIFQWIFIIFTDNALHWMRRYSLISN